MKIKLEVDAYKCERCGYEWQPIKDSPIVCPKCKSPYWDKPRKINKKKINHEK